MGFRVLSMNIVYIFTNNVLNWFSRMNVVKASGGAAIIELFGADGSQEVFQPTLRQ